MGPLKVFGGSSHTSLTATVCGVLNIPVGRVATGTFPNGESSVQILENVRGADVFVVQSMARPVNHHLVELLCLVDALVRSGAGRITGVVPFFAYDRQDCRGCRDVPIGAKLMANLLVAAGINRLVVFDVHTPQLEGFFDIPIDFLSADDIFSDLLREWTFGVPATIFSPDVGGMKRALHFAQSSRCPVGVVFKCRHDDGSVEILDVVGEVRDRNVVIVDDRVETGQTIAGAASRLKQLGARSIRAIVTHGAMTDGTLDDLWKSGVECLATTNTLPTLPPSPRVQTRDVTPRLADAVIRIHNNLPVVPYSR